MGKTFKYYCPKCHYEVYTSGELASGFFVVVEPFICKDCNELTDVAVGIIGQKMRKDELPKDEEIEFNKCTNCNS